MRASLNTAIDLIIRHEGGFVNHPSDPGGPTNMGITLATYRARVDRRGTVADLRKLTWNQAADIYRRHYWDAVRGDDLPAGLDLVLFDMAVNAGPGQAVRLLQSLLGVATDGQLGPQTLSAVAAGDPLDLIRRYSIRRLRYYEALPGWKTFWRGWTERVHQTREAALALAQKKSPETPV